MRRGSRNYPKENPPKVRLQERELFVGLAANIGPAPPPKFIKEREEFRNERREKTRCVRGGGEGGVGALVESIIKISGQQKIGGQQHEPRSDRGAL